jgi:diaminopimelate decarboxylase
LDDLAGRMRRRPDVLVRVNPGVEAHTHEYVQTGITDCKFGLGATDGMALAAVDSILASTNLQLAGFHCHIGSQIFELDAYRTAVNAMAAFIKQVNLATGYFPAELDLGGGLGIRYTDNDQKMEISVAVALMSSAVKQVFQDKGWELPYLILEPGRSIVGEAGLAVYRVGVVKNIPGARTYVAVDGGMSDNPRVALYNSQYEAVVANRVRSDLRQTVTIAGKCCESGDLLAKDIELGPVQRGDLVAVFSAGAYQYSMASNYNRIPRPAVVMANHAGADLIIKRETYADLLKSDIVPERFCARQEHVVGL